MEFRYERKRRDRALLGCSMADGGRIVRFARLSPGASVAVEVRKGRGKVHLLR
jgi:hypothetical protein